MIPHLTSAEYITGYTIHVRFADGVEGDVDLAAQLWAEVFEPLGDVDAFRQFELNTDLNKITWLTGADLAPEFLYEQARRHAGTEGR